MQFLSLRSLAKSYFTGVGGQEISGKLKRRMPLTLGKRVEQGQLSLLNSWQLSEWSVGCSFTKRKRQLYNLELKLVSMVCCNQMSHDYCPYYLILVSNYFLHCDLISVSELIVVKKKSHLSLVLDKVLKSTFSVSYHYTNSSYFQLSAGANRH